MRTRLSHLTTLLLIAAIAFVLPAIATASTGNPGVIDGQTRRPIGPSAYEDLVGIVVNVYDAEACWNSHTTPAPIHTTTSGFEGLYSISGVSNAKPVIISFSDPTGKYRDTLFPYSGRHVTDGPAFYPDDLDHANGYLSTLADVRDYRTFRVAGRDRYQTAIAISQTNFYQADTVVLASGLAFADSLAASPLAGLFGAPLLLTDPASLPAGVLDEIGRLQASQIIIVGGEKSVTPAVVSQLKKRGYSKIARIAGRDRYETASNVAGIMFDLKWTPESIEDSTMIPFICRGDLFSDALSISPFAYAETRPVLLTQPSGLSPHTASVWNYMTNKAQHSSAIVVGGKVSVTDAVLNDLREANGHIPGRLNYSRYAGSDRYATARAVIEGYWGDEPWQIEGFDFVAVASGEKFPDALAGGVAAGYHGGALMLTPGGSLGRDARHVLQGNGPFVMNLEVLGGEQTLAPRVATEARSALGTSMYDMDSAGERIETSGLAAVGTSLMAPPTVQDGFTPPELTVNSGSMRGPRTYDGEPPSFERLTELADGV